MNSTLLADSYRCLDEMAFHALRRYDPVRVVGCFAKCESSQIYPRLASILPDVSGSTPVVMAFSANF